MKYTIDKSEAGDRLDKFLVTKILDKSRSQLQKLIKANLVFVNGKPVSAHYSLQADDIVEIKSLENVMAEPVETKKQKQIELPELEVISETSDYLIINKPAGVIVHPTESTHEKTLVDMLLKKYPKIEKVGEDPTRPGIVHRLDKEVSGLMVVAKNNDFFESLKYQFQKRVVQKTYTALAYGRIINDDDLIRFPIDRSASGYKMSALPITTHGELTDRGRRALTEFSVIKKFVNYTLIKVRIKTGRTHQIRVHFCAYGHPLVGDDLYGTHKTKLQNAKLGLGRIFLVADELSFLDRSGQKKEFMLDLPIELKEFLNKVK